MCSENDNDNTIFILPRVIEKKSFDKKNNYLTYDSFDLK